MNNSRLLLGSIGRVIVDIAIEHDELFLLLSDLSWVWSQKIGKSHNYFDCHLFTGRQVTRQVDLVSRTSLITELLINKPYYLLDSFYIVYLVESWDNSVTFSTPLSSEESAN